MTENEILEIIKYTKEIIPKSNYAGIEALDIVISIIKEVQQYREIGTVEECREARERRWIPVERELPPNAKHKGALCPLYQVMTKYGVTEGWYNPDLESWYVLVWFMTDRYLDGEIDFERGDKPKVLRLANAVNNVQHILTAWKPLEPYLPERSEEE